MQDGHVVELGEHPRMADFAEYAEVISRCMGYPSGQFLAAYYNNIKLQMEEALESNPISVALIKLLDTRKVDDWKGTATELLGELEDIASTALKINTKGRTWPKSPNVLSRRLNELKTNLRETGIHVERQKDSNTKERLIFIKKREKDTPEKDIDGTDEAKDRDLDENGSIKDTNFSVHISSTDTTSVPNVKQPKETPTEPSPSLYRFREGFSSQNQDKNGDEPGSKISSPTETSDHTLDQLSGTRDDRDDLCGVNEGKADEISDLFWLSFDELESLSADKLVRGQDLRDMLVSSGKIYTSDAALFVEEMRKKEKIKEIGYDTYIRRVIVQKALEGKDQQ
jgi:hypothetical protein